MSFTDAYETNVLNWVFTANAVTRPSSWSIALYTVAPGETGGGTEVSGGSYARQSVTMSVSGANATNAAQIDWPAATANWGTVVACAVFDQAGTMLAYAPLTTSKAINTGDILRLPASSLTFTLN